MVETKGGKWRSRVMPVPHGRVGMYKATLQRIRIISVKAVDYNHAMRLIVKEKEPEDRVLKVERLS